MEWRRWHGPSAAGSRGPNGVAKMGAGRLTPTVDQVQRRKPTLDSGCRWLQPCVGLSVLPSLALVDLCCGSTTAPAQLLWIPRKHMTHRKCFRVVDHTMTFPCFGPSWILSNHDRLSQEGNPTRAERPMQQRLLFHTTDGRIPKKLQAGVRIIAWWATRTETTRRSAPCGSCECKCSMSTSLNAEARSMG